MHAIKTGFSFILCTQCMKKIIACVSTCNCVPPFSFMEILILSSLGKTLSISENTVKFLNRDQAELTNRFYCNCQALMNKVLSYHELLWRIQGASTPRQLRFEDFVYRNERIWTLRGRSPGTPPRSANELYCPERNSHNFLVCYKLKIWTNIITLQKET